MMKTIHLTKFTAIFIAAFAFTLPVYAEDQAYNNVEIIEQPVPTYPVGALSFGASGRCNVKFDLFNYSRIRVTSAKCSHQIFCEPSYTAIKKGSYRVIDMDGAPSPGYRGNIVAPIIFVMDGKQPPPAGIRLTACAARPTS